MLIFSQPQASFYPGSLKTQREKQVLLFLNQGHGFPVAAHTYGSH